jgi:integrase
MSLSLFLPAPTSDPIAELRQIFRNSLVSAHTKRAYISAFNQFFALVAETGRPVCRALLMEYRAQLIDQGLSASTINVRLSAIRKLVCEARDNNLLDPVESARILTVPGVPTRGVRLGNWLTREEAKRLLAVPDRGSLIGKRAFAILSVLVYCALRRDELARLEMRHIQKREGRWVIADLVGKRGRVRTIPIPDAAKDALDDWLAAAGIQSGFLCRQLLRSGLVLGQRISSWTVWKTVVTAAKAAGINHLGPHDLRRSSAKFCRKAGGDIEQIQKLLGHEDISTTVLYLGTKQDIRQAVNDRIAL